MDKGSQFIKRSTEYFPLAALVVINILIGIFIIHDYGESWDEHNYFFYADQSIRAYTGLFQPGYVPSFDPTIRHYGPVYTMPAVLLWRAFLGIYISDFQHAINWVTFQAGLVVFFLLARRWLNTWASFGATLLFATQPLLWGHAFINPKDTPYMVGFMASIFFGLKMLDAVEKLDEPPAPVATFTPDVFHADMEAMSASSRRWLIILAAGGILTALVFAVWVNAAWPFPLSSYQDDGSAVELANYLRGLVSQIRLIVLSIIFIFLAIHWLVMPRLPRTHASIQAEFSPFKKNFTLYLRHRAVGIAAFVLGLTLSIRLLAFVAAGLIGILLFLRRRKDMAPLLVAYGLVAFAVMYITWPYLWWEPVVRFLVTLRVMLNFPWPGQTLFDGMYYSPDMLPSRYLPVLWGIQFTESFILLMLLGLSLFIAKVVRRHIDRELTLIVGLWTLFPLVAVVITRPNLYDNGRQLFFILPPLFLLCGLGLQFIFSRIKQPAIRVLLVILILFPGILGIVQLHPYEYIYYNHFIGGAKGAERRFELDYWGTSYRHVAAYLNEHAPANAQVLVSGPAFSLSRYIRTDIQVVSWGKEADLDSDSYYVVMLTRNDSDLKYFTDAPTVHKVEIMGALLSVVKRVE